MTSDISERMVILDNEFAKYGLVRRNDSKLCNQFIYGGNFDEKYDSVEKIVERMVKLNEQYTRRENLDNEFAKFDMERRDDSKLCNKYIYNGILEKRFNSVEKIVSRMIEMDYRYKYSPDERRQMLEIEFKKIGIERRSDSKLCNNFIDNAYLTAEYNSVTKIVNRMRQVHYLYTYTDYEETLQKILKSCEEKTEKDYIKPQVEAEYITLDGKGYPGVWPWENKNITIIIDTMAEDFPALKK